MRTTGGLFQAMGEKKAPEIVQNFNFSKRKPDIVNAAN
jgi:hypothetical protein